MRTSLTAQDSIRGDVVAVNITPWNDESPFFPDRKRWLSSPQFYLGQNPLHPFSRKRDWNWKGVTALFIMYALSRMIHNHRVLRIFIAVRSGEDYTEATLVRPHADTAEKYMRTNARQTQRMYATTFIWLKLQASQVLIDNGECVNSHLLPVCLSLPTR